MSKRAGEFSEAACLGRPDLFESIDWRDHLDARRRCIGCPALAACRAEVAEILETATVNSVLAGTWAGELYGRRGQRRAYPPGLARI